MRWGIPYVRMKSQPVPRASTASSTPSRPASPFATSFTEPSPPTTTRSEAPPSAAARASSVRWPGRSEKRTSPSSPCRAASWWISGQRLPVEPFADAGLTRKTVSALMLGGHRGERDPGHPVDGGAQFVVGDPRERALDDDVADGEEAPGFDSPERPEREEHRRLHLDREDAAARPALVLPLVRVVEEVARDDRPDPHRLAHLLRHVHRAVDERPRGGRDVLVGPDEVARGGVGRDRREGDDQVAEREVGLEAAARADAQESLDAELDELLDDDRRRRTAHPRRLHRDRPALVLAGVAEHPALAVSLHGVLEIRLGDVLRPQRVTGEETRLGVVARLGTDVDRHRATLTRLPKRRRAPSLALWRRSSTRGSTRSSPSAPRIPWSASSSRTSPAAGSAGSPPWRARGG